ncbi:MAG: hypothetical protein AMJ53_18340 [Gammaproteobacteria bacterium SG8_11]|nr:MAG: hypothetical protein AMJ53_18340 [Gammaproteobacteria bacterium SG8_11]
MKKFGELFFLGVIVFLLASCSSGGSDNSNGGNNNPPGGNNGDNEDPIVQEPAPPNTGSGSGPYLPFRGSLNVLDTSDNSVYSISTADVEEPAIIFRSNGSTISELFTSQQQSLMVYMENGRLWKVSIDQGSDLNSTHVSSASVADICDHFIEYNILELNTSNPEDSMILYELPGADNNCGTRLDNEKYYVKPSFSSSTPPVNITSKINFTDNVEVIFDANDIASGAKGLLAVNGNQLVRYDNNFENPTTIHTATNFISMTIYSSGPVLSGKFLRIDDAIHWYGYSDNVLSGALLDIPGSFSENATCEATQCFFYLIDNEFNTQIYKIVAGGGSVATLVGTVPAQNGMFTDMGYIHQTTNYLYYTLNENNQGENQATLYRIAKAGGIPESVDVANSISILFLSGINEIYYSKTVNNEDGTTTPYAVAKSEDGSNIVNQQNARWVGSVNLIFQNSHITGSKLVMASDFTNYTNTGMAGGGLQVFDLGSNAPTIQLGTLIESVNDIVFFGYGTQVLGIGTITTPNLQMDVFTIDVTESDSLQRITTTTDKSERFVL